MRITIKIGMVTRHFPPGACGGTGYHVYHLSKKLVERGHKVTVYTRKLEGHLEEEWTEGIHIKRFKYFTFPVGKSQEISFELLRLLLADELDLIHLHTLNLLGIIAGFISFMKRIPYFITIHAWNINSSLNIVERILLLIHYYLIRDRAMRKAKAIFCASKNEVEQISQIKGGNVYHIPNGVDLDMFDSSHSTSKFREEYNLKNRKLILSVGSICKQKAQLTLIKALPEIVKRFPNVVCIFVGPILDREYYSEIKKEIQQSSLENHVIFTGMVDTKELLSIYKSCNLFVLTSIYETSPLVIPEAWASKIPVIANSIPNLTAIIEDGINGILFTTNDFKDLTEKIELILTDKALVGELIKNGREEVKGKYSWSRIAEITEKNYLS